MNMRIWGGALGAATAIVATAVQAAPALDAATAQDLRCIAVTTAVVKLENRKPGVHDSLAPMFAEIFYAGRIDARHPDLDIARAIKAIDVGTDEAAIQAESERCGQILLPVMQKVYGPFEKPDDDPK